MKKKIKQCLIITYAILFQKRPQLWTFLKQKGQLIIKQYLISIIIMTAVFFVGFDKVYAADERKVTSILTSYIGDSLIVGEEYDVEKLTVTAEYDDGTSEVISDYSTGTRKITRDGENKFVVVYKGKSDTFTIIGKTVLEISATYNGGSHSIGNKVNAKEVMVQVTYSDHSTDTISNGYTLSQAVISRIGDNEVTVVYAGKRATFSVFGTEAKTVESVYAEYLGEARTKGGTIREEDIMLTALYTDGTSESIYNYSLNPSIVQNTGLNTINITYKGKSDKIVIEGIEKVITGITAKYTGGDVTVGKTVRMSNITVTATYNDGTTGSEDEFSIVGGGKIAVVGNNVLTVDAQGQKADITVVGVEASSADFATAPAYDITNNRRSASIAIDMPSDYKAEDILVESIDSALVKRILTREIRDGDYIPFTILLADLDLDTEFPLTVQVTIPEDYNINGCHVYFTPNRKSVIAQMNAEIIDNKYLQFTLFHEGTYILSYDFNWNEQEIN